MQKKVNEICQMIKRDGQSITVANVRKFLDKKLSYFEVADKVLLYKEDPKKAQEVAKKEADKVAEKPADGVYQLIEQCFAKHDKTQAFSDISQLKLNLIDVVNSHMGKEVKNKTRHIEQRLRKLQQKNDHAEVQYYGLYARFQELNTQYELLQDAHYKLQQEHQYALSKATIRKSSEDKAQKPAKMRDYQTQMSLLKSDCCAVYDIERQQIIVKAPVKHKIVRELEKGSRSFQLLANSVYDFSTKCWILDSFEAQTINLLVRNQFVISKELSYVLHLLQKRQEQ